MFKDEDRKAVGRSDNVVAASIILDRLNDAELIALYEDIRGRLPATNLEDMNVEAELLLQFHTIRALQGQVIADEGTPANQKAQVANAVSSSLKQIADLQDRTYSNERFKRVELLLIRVLSKLPEDVAAAFLDEFARDYKIKHEVT